MAFVSITRLRPRRRNVPTGGPAAHLAHQEAVAASSSTLPRRLPRYHAENGALDRHRLGRRNLNASMSQYSLSFLRNAEADSLVQ